MFAASAGHRDASWFNYVTFKTSDPGDIPNVFAALALVVYDLKYKLANQKSPSTWSLVLAFVALFTVSSCIWGFFYVSSKDQPTSLDHAIWTSGAVITSFVVPFTYLGMQLDDGRRYVLVGLLDAMTFVSVGTCFISWSQLFWLVGSLQAL